MREVIALALLTFAPARRDHFVHVVRLEAYSACSELAIGRCILLPRARRHRLQLVHHARRRRSGGDTGVVGEAACPAAASSSAAVREHPEKEHIVHVQRSALRGYRRPGGRHAGRGGREGGAGRGRSAMAAPLEAVEE